MELFVKRQLPIAACIYLGQMLVGFAMGWTSPVIPKLQDVDKTPFTNLVTISDGQASWVASTLYIGCVIGPHISGYLSNVIGRKPCLMMGGLLTLISFVMVVFTRNLATVYALRIVKGFGTGIIVVCNFVYLGEIGSTSIRGILLTSIGIFSSMGTLVVYSVAPYVSYAATGYVGIALTLVYIVGLFFVPETPMFYVMKGKDDEAQETLKLLGRDEDAEGLKKTKIEMEEEEKNKAKWTDLFTIKSNRKAIFILLVLSILQQLSGVIAVIFFVTTIFELAGSSIRPDIATIIIGCTQLVSSSITPMFVERAGRRVLLMTSSAICCISLATLGTYFYLDEVDHSIVARIGWVPLLSLIIFFLSYDMGFGIIPGTLTGEMFTMNSRSTGSAVTVTAAWIFGFGVTSAFGYMVSSLGGAATFWMFSCACAFAVLFTAIFVPETRGKSLQEIEEIMSR